ncbi:hypothetical protein [Rickettsia conorii]|nr:hypothetical protein [Rickettsia conorii]
MGGSYARRFFDKMKAEKQIKDIKNNKINPYNDAMKKDSRKVG